VDEEPALQTPQTGGRKHVPRWPKIVALIIAGAIVCALIVVLVAWPFTQEKVAKELGQTFAAHVEIGKFHSTYFPTPGCVAENITFHGRRSQGTIQRLTIQADYPTMLTFQHRLTRIRGDGLYVKVLANEQKFQAPTGKSGHPNLVVSQVIADRSVLEIERSDGSQPLRFDIHELKLYGVAANRAIKFQTALRNPEPPGEIRTSGSLGPWIQSQRGNMPLSGRYDFEQADLGVFHVVAGTLSSKGQFNGVLKQLDVQGSVQIPNFEVTDSGHRQGLSTEFKATVNGTNGDVELHPAVTHFEGTTVTSTGSIAGTHGKTIRLQMTSRGGHIQDLLRMFTKSSRPPMVGVISFHGNVVVPPAKEQFLRKLELAADFGIGGDFTNPSTQKNVDVLSERARGDKHDDNDPQNVVENLKGRVVTRNGIAEFTGVSFDVPGAAAHLAGTFNLLNERIDLGGKLAMQADLSQATKGIKSFLLIPLDPFFKKKHAGAVIPIRITGTYQHPSYGISLGDKQANKIAKRLSGRR